MLEPLEIINTHNIHCINYYINVKNFCPLGNANYTNEFKVSIKVGKIMADFCEVQQEIESRLSDKDLIIEDAMVVIGEITRKYYRDASTIFVSTKVEDAAHFKVELSAYY